MTPVQWKLLGTSLAVVHDPKESGCAGRPWAIVHSGVVYLYLSDTEFGALMDCLDRIRQQWPTLPERWATS